MSNVFLTLEKTLKRLNPHMILEDNERHRIRTWLNILPKNYLKRNFALESNIYDDGRLKINIESSHPSHPFYTALHEPYSTEYIKKYR